MRVLSEYESVGPGERSALLRREGLYSSAISEWRKQRDEGGRAALSPPRGRPPADPLEREVGRLRRDNERLHDELSKLQRVVKVQGELSALLEELAGASADSTGERSS